jgi:hypothetical protein
MGFIVNAKLLNKDLVPLLVELNQDLIDSYEEITAEDCRCCLKPVSAYLPPFFLRLRVRILEGGHYQVENVPEPSFKGYVQLHVVPTVFLIKPYNDTCVELEGDVQFTNPFPVMVERAIHVLKDKMFTRLKIFVASL